jgi:hypothetical protein
MNRLAIAAKAVTWRDMDHIRRSRREPPRFPFTGGMCRSMIAAAGSQELPAFTNGRWRWDEEKAC